MKAEESKSREAITQLIAALLEWGDKTAPDAVERQLRPFQKIIIRLSKRFTPGRIAARLSEAKEHFCSRITAADLEKCLKKWKAVKRRRGAKSAGGNGGSVGNSVAA